MKAIPTIGFVLLLSNSAVALTCADLDGASVIAYDGKYLGFFGSPLADDSINNSLGTYGSESSSSSVRNAFSSYGSEFGIYSANNEISSKAPAIIALDGLLAWLTTNSLTKDGVSLADIDANCTFHSAAPVSGFVDPPSSLTGLKASDGEYSDKVALTWDETDQASFYDVYIADSLDGTRTFVTTTAALRADITGGSPGTVYYYFVVPSNAVGKGTGQWDTGHVDASIRTPTDFSAITSNNTATTAVFGLAASSDMGETFSTRFRAGDEVRIIGAAQPQDEDIGKPGYVYVVARITTAGGDTWAYRDLEGTFKPWDVRLDTLEPAYTTASLENSAVFLVYEGALISAYYGIYIGYRRAESNTLHYTPTALGIDVSE